MYCTGCGAVRGASVSSCVVLWLFCGRGHCGVSRGRTVASPSLRGGPHAVAAPANWTDLPGHPCRESPGLFRPISLAFVGVQQTVGCQSTRATPWIARRGPEAPSDARLHALLNASAASESTAAGSLEAASSNASAASESTTAGGLEAFPLSQLRWSRQV